MNLSAKAWHESTNIIEAIFNHPFNRALKRGTLDKRIFAYYMEQDKNYLQDFARCYQYLWPKSPPAYAKRIKKYADPAYIIKQEADFDYFKEKFNYGESGCITPARYHYTQRLKKICRHSPFELGIAATLPCFWIYLELGIHMKRHGLENNPYSDWILTYSSANFNQSVNNVLETFNGVGHQTDINTQRRMIETFRISAAMEWHFWNDAYFERKLDGRDINSDVTNEVGAQFDIT